MIPEMIEKEHIPQYVPVKQDVLGEDDSRKTRMQQLMRFLKGGNTFQVKAKIVFQTLQGLKAVKTTIWNVSETHVALKGGLTIPVHSILEVQA
jgi:hypothetical protein